MESKDSPRLESKTNSKEEPEDPNLNRIKCKISYLQDYLLDKEDIKLRVQSVSFQKPKLNDSLDQAEDNNLVNHQLKNRMETQHSGRHSKKGSARQDKLKHTMESQGPHSVEKKVESVTGENGENSRNASVNKER